jgi:hypothetical protein
MDNHGQAYTWDNGDDMSKSREHSTDIIINNVNPAAT